MKTTINDIARACNVSAAAVSLALAGKKGRVSAATAERIIETARRMNYMPNQMASNLARGRSKTIGIVFNDVRNPHIAEIFMVVSTRLQRRGFTVVSHVLDEQTSGQYEKLAGQVASENICALIWAKAYEEEQTQENELFYRYMEKLEIPVFTMDRYELNCPGYNVCFDYEKAGYLATRYLIEQGHRKIGCIAGNREFYVTRARKRGYRQALEEAGIPFSEKNIVHGDYTIAGGRNALPYLIGQGVTAVFAQNDEMAFGVYGAARQYGLRIPDDLSIIGCDNVPFTEVLEVPLSTVRVPAEEMGDFMAEKICEEIDHPTLRERKTVYYQPDLFIRGSVRRINNEKT